MAAPTAPKICVQRCKKTFSTASANSGSRGIIRSPRQRRWQVGETVMSGCGDSKLSAGGTAFRGVSRNEFERLMRSRGGQRHDKRLFSVGKLIAIAFNSF